jgi:hypothetical protein
MHRRRIVSTLARSTGVSISEVGQVVSGSRVGGPPQRFHGQDQYSRGIPGGVRTVESPSVSPLRILSSNVLGPVGDKVEEWTLKGAFITSADFGEMDWTDSGEPATISLTLSVDYCILQY